MKKPLPEKTEEILFNRYFLQGFRLGEVTTYAPSSVEEAKNGYDSKFLGLSTFHEIYLQFKAPTYSKKGLFTIRTTCHQHQILRTYPSLTAYYVAHTFISFRECTEAQQNIRESVDFLKHFIAIEIASLPEDIEFFHYRKPPSHRESPQITYKCISDGNTRKAVNEVTGDGWLRGNQLVEKFKDGQAGSLILLTQDEENDLSINGDSTQYLDDRREARAPEKVWRLSPQKVSGLFSEYQGSNFGIQVRKW